MKNSLIYLVIVMSILTNCTLETGNRESIHKVNSGNGLVLGTKIYEPPADVKALFNQWEKLGFNTVVGSIEINSDAQFRELADQHKIKRFIICPIFYDGELDKKPELYAKTDKNSHALKSWVKFACPTHPIYREQKIAEVKAAIRKTKPDGISIDFIRHFVFWEMVYPDRTAASLENTCFCPGCMNRFQEDTHINIPRKINSAESYAVWINTNCLPTWIDWKCSTIEDMVRELVQEAKSIKPSLLVNIHAVPWREDDFGGAVRRVAGQDLTKLAQYADYISPMTYSHMVKRPPEWVSSVVSDMVRRVQCPVIPSIQVGTAYLEKELTVDEFKSNLNHALKPPSNGIIFWKWEALVEAPLKLQAVKEAFGALSSPESEN